MDGTDDISTSGPCLFAVIVVPRHAKVRVTTLELDTDSENVEGQDWLSNDMRRQFLFLAHECQHHQKPYKMKRTLTQRVWWPFMWEHMITHYKGCSNCSPFFTAEKHTGLSIQVSGRFRVVHIDTKHLKP